MPHVPTPMRLLRVPQPFDHPDFIFEPKIDGFRALAHVRGHHCTLVSRNGYDFKSWPQLAEEIAHAVRAHSAILDGEICCLEPDGTSNFKRLLFRRDGPHFYAFDVLSINGRDFTRSPLLERKDDCDASCLRWTAGYCSSIGSLSADVTCSASRATVTLRASWRSGHPVRIRPMAASRRGLK